MSDQFGVPGLQPEDLAQKLADGEAIILLDVREPVELKYAALKTAVVHVPLSRMAAEHLASLPPPIDAPTDREIVVICHHGVRSAQVTAWLRSHGYSQVYNLDGGIDAYARDVDPGIGRY